MSGHSMGIIDVGFEDPVPLTCLGECTNNPSGSLGEGTLGVRCNAPLSDMTTSKLLKGMKQPYTAHGFRSSFPDWVSEETNHPSDVAEAALAHIVANKTKAAYRRGNLLEKRRLMMTDWAEFCEGRGT